MKTKNFYVRPRYTCGSPGMVDEKTALLEALDEKEAFIRKLDGSYGNDEMNNAKTRGLSGIVYSRYQVRNTLHYQDLITGEIWTEKVKKS